MQITGQNDTKDVGGEPEKLRLMVGSWGTMTTTVVEGVTFGQFQQLRQGSASGQKG